MRPLGESEESYKEFELLVALSVAILCLSRVCALLA